MELSLLLLKQIIAMMVMVLVGFVMAKKGLLNSRESQIISKMVIYALTPAAILDSFQTELDQNKLEGMAASLLAAAMIYAAFLLCTKLLTKGRRPLTEGEQASVIYSNSCNMAIPIIMNTLGGEFVIYSCAYVLVQNVMTWTHCQVLLGGTSELSVKRVITNPFILATIGGGVMFLSDIHFPGPVGNAVTSLGACLGPVSMVIIGIMLADVDFRQLFSSFGMYYTVFLRLVGYPVLAMVIVGLLARFWFGTGDIMGPMTVMMLCASGPSATTQTQMAQLYDHPERGYMSSINAVTTILSAVTMPAMILLFQLMPL